MKYGNPNGRMRDNQEGSFLLIGKDFKWADQEDFNKNPLKYELFKTARIAVDIPSSPCLKIGDFVSVKYLHSVKNKAFNEQSMPVYKVVSPDFPDESSVLYACALKDFVL